MYRAVPSTAPKGRSNAFAENSGEIRLNVAVRMSVRSALDARQPERLAVELVVALQRLALTEGL